MCLSAVSPGTAQVVGAFDDLGMDFLDALAGLVDKRLVRPLEVGSGERALWMLETIASTVWSSSPPAAKRRPTAAARRVFPNAGGRKQQSPYRPQQGAWLGRQEVELGNLRGRAGVEQADASRTEFGVCAWRGKWTGFGKGAARSTKAKLG